MLNESTLPADWGKRQGPALDGPGRGGDAAMARQYPGVDGYGVGDGPDRDFAPMFKAGPMDGMGTMPRMLGVPMNRPAWGGARGVEPVHPGGEDFPIPGQMPFRRLDPGGVPIGQGGVVPAAADTDPLQALALELARQRQV